jgi:hypothetical protein
VQTGTGTYQAEVGTGSGARAETFLKSETELEPKQIGSAPQHYYFPRLFPRLILVPGEMYVPILLYSPSLCCLIRGFVV